MKKILYTEQHITFLGSKESKNNDRGAVLKNGETLYYRMRFTAATPQESIEPAQNLAKKYSGIYFIIATLPESSIVNYISVKTEKSNDLVLKPKNDPTPLRGNPHARPRPILRETMRLGKD
ncbi:MAG TPA: hypothetical protein DCY07_05615 [Rhodospirillaceae bacterium]|nr:hypothetical protein [Rhodospirillaceae bacterium]